MTYFWRRECTKVGVCGLHAGAYSEDGSWDGHCDWPVVVDTLNVGAGRGGSSRNGLWRRGGELWTDSEEEGSRR
jgi:hypothetical protein